MRSERGFVLAMTLWLLAGIAVVVGLMTWWALAEVRAATEERERVDDAAAMLRARETLLYLAATREFTQGGLSVEGIDEVRRAIALLEEFGRLRKEPIGDELRVDGTQYAWGDTRFALQDEAGLFSLVRPTPVQFDRFLEAHDIPAGSIPGLRDAFLDYIDSDSLSRLAGAENAHYRQAGRRAPPQRRLLAPTELQSVLGWDRLPEATLRSIIERSTPYYAGAINLNALPATLLPSLIAGCPEACERFVQQRRIRPFANARDAQLRASVGLPGDDAIDYLAAPSDSFRITLWGRTGVGWRLHVRLTPLADKAGPWTVLAAYPIPRPLDDAPAPLPESALLADAAPGGREGGAPPAGRAPRTDRGGGAARGAPLPAP
jgi:type II secretory pathway component PulK